MNKNILIIGALAIIIIVFGVVVFNKSRVATKKVDLKFNLPKIMNLQSEAFSNNQTIPAKYTCDGGNVNPPLAISDVPQNAKSLVLIIDDPDAVNGAWSHWLVWNIDPSVREITENSVPIGATEGTTDFGRTGYGGPCPPSGSHRYFFKLYALDAVLDLSPDKEKKDLETAMDGHIIDQATIIGLYK